MDAANVKKGTCAYKDLVQIQTTVTPALTRLDGLSSQPLD